MTDRRIDLGYTPHLYQQQVHDALANHRFAVVVSHRRWGKTVMAVNTLINAALMANTLQPRFAYVAPRLKQAKQTAWQYMLQYTNALPGMKRSESELYIEFPDNGARITLYGCSDGNEEAMRGLYLDGLVVDEVAGVRMQVWDQILRPAIADRQGWVLFIGTPRGIDSFHALWEQAKEDPNWLARMYRVDETHLPWLPPEEIELARKAMSDAAFRQEWMCDFSAVSDDVLITIDLVSAAVKREYTQLDIDFAPRILGVDVARFGDDRSVIQRRQGLVAYEPMVISHKDNMWFAAAVAEEIVEWQADACFIDAGRGEGVIDRLRQMGHRIQEINFGGKPTNPKYANKRSEMWDLCKVWLEQGGQLPNNSDLKTDLCTPCYQFDAGGRFMLERKEHIRERGRKSTDLGDALCLTFAAKVVSRRGNASDFDHMPEVAVGDG